MPQIVPIVLGIQTPDVAIMMAKAIKEVSENLGRRVRVVASSDLNHYEPHSITVAKDLSVLKCVENLDIDCFYTTMEELNVSICGYGAIATAMDYTRRHGGRAKLLKHMTSGDVSGDYGSVVGYAAVKFFK